MYKYFKIIAAMIDCIMMIETVPNSTLIHD